MVTTTQFRQKQETPAGTKRKTHKTAKRKGGATEHPMTEGGNAKGEPGTVYQKSPGHRGVCLEKKVPHSKISDSMGG